MKMFLQNNIFELEVEISDPDYNYYHSLPNEYYNQIQNPLHKSLYSITLASANIKSGKDNFEEYCSHEDINDIKKYSQIMKNDLEDGFPTILLMKKNDQLLLIDGKKRILAQLLAGQENIRAFVIIPREDLKDILDKNFINSIKEKYLSKRWFDGYQDILELGIIGKRRYSGRFPKVLDFSCVDNTEVVDFGCSNGMALFQAYYCGARKCIGFDYVQENVDIINELAKRLKINVSAHRIDFNDKNFEKQAIEITGGWDYSLFLSVYRTKELINRERLLEFIWSNSRKGMFFEGHTHPQLDSIEFYNDILSKLSNSKKTFLGRGNIETSYINYHSPKFFIEKI